MASWDELCITREQLTSGSSHCHREKAACRVSRPTARKQKVKHTVKSSAWGSDEPPFPLPVSFHIQHFILFSTEIILCGRTISL